MKRAVLLVAIVVSGCAAQVTPEMRKLAEERKGQQHKIEVVLTPEDNFSRKCGHVKPNESYACAQKLLQWKIEEQAFEYCVFYGPFKIQWEGTNGLAYNRATKASTTVTCTGTRQQSGN